MYVCMYVRVWYVCVCVRACVCVCMCVGIMVAWDGVLSD